MRWEWRIREVRLCKDCGIRGGSRGYGECERFREVIGLEMGRGCWHPMGTILVRENIEVKV